MGRLFAFIVARLPCRPSTDDYLIQSIWRNTTNNGTAIQPNGDGNTPNGTHLGGYNIQFGTTVAPTNTTNISVAPGNAAESTAT